MNAYRAHLGLEPVADQLAATQCADAIVAFTHEAFDRALAERPRQLHYVGPLACAQQPVTDAALPWSADDTRPIVLISYSTSFQNQLPALQRVADAVATLPIRVLMTLGRAITPDELRLPPNVVARQFVPHAAVLPQARLVVTHAGHGTVMAAVTAGVPLLCTPMGRDQHAVASCVEERQLGVVVPATASTEALRVAIATALADRAMYERTRNFAAGLDVDGGLAKAIAVLEHMTRAGSSGRDAS